MRKILGNKISIYLVITRLDKSHKVDKLEGASMHLLYVMEKNNNLPSSFMHECQKTTIVNFIIQKLKNKHISIKNIYRLSNPRSCDSEFRILISVQKMCPLKALVVKNSVLHDFGFGKVSPAKQL